MNKEHLAEQLTDLRNKFLSDISTSMMEYFQKVELSINLFAEINKVPVAKERVPGEPMTHKVYPGDNVEFIAQPLGGQLASVSTLVQSSEEIKKDDPPAFAFAKDTSNQ